MSEYQAYAIRLDWEAVKKNKTAIAKFIRKNKHARKKAGAFYVGATGIDPEERWLQHKGKLTNGRDTSSFLVREFGIRISPIWMSSRLVGYSSEDALHLERLVAKHLKRKGYAVYSDALPDIIRKTQRAHPQPSSD